MNKITTDAIEWIKNYFKTTNGRKAVIGISGGKDSTVAAIKIKFLRADKFALPL
jgi:NH3-dependent NAD+ synthetase